MADLNYDISVGTRDAVNSINGLKSALGALAGAFALKEVIAFSDGITTLRNKLMSVTPDLDTVSKQFNAIAAIAISSRTPIEAVADLYSKIQRSAQALGISQAEAAQITDSLAKALTASGMSSKEAAGPLLQLGQALQSGVFQGDELRSILEGLPQVAQALATQLNVPVGALKKLGSEGQISADVFVKAMRLARDSIDDAFGKTTPTITSALGTLKTISQVAFNEFEQNTQTGRNLGSAIEYMAFTFWQLTKRIDEFAGTIATIAKWTAIILSFTALGAIIRSIAATFVFFGEAIMGVVGFFKGFFQGATAIQTWAIGLSPILKSAVDALVLLGAALAGAMSNSIFTWFKDFFISANEFIDKMFSAGDSTSTAGEELKAFREELAKQKAGLDDTASASKNAAYLAEELAKKLALARLEMVAQVGGLDRGLKQTQERLALENQFLSMNKDRINISADEITIAKMLTDIDIERRNTLASLTDQLNKQTQEYENMRVKDSEAGKEARGRIGILQEQIKKTGEVYDKHAVGMAQLTQNNLNLKVIEEDRKRTQENIIKAIDEQISRNQKLGDTLRNVNGQRADVGRQRTVGDVAGLSSLQKQILDIQDAAARAGREASAAFAANFEDNGDGLTAERSQELADGLIKIADSYKNLATTQEEFASKNYESSRTFSTGWNEAFTKFAEDASNQADQARSYFDSLTNGVADAFGKMAQSGDWSFKNLKAGFKDLANSMIGDFIRIMAKKAILGMFGGEGGFLGGLFGKANGGGVQGETPYIVGERGPELFIPRSAGTIVPNNQLGGSAPASQPSVVTYNISAVDASSFRSMIARDPSFLYAVTEKGRQSQPRARMA